jgi:hypothetical protein
MGTTNSKPPGPIITIDESKILSCSQAQFITSFLEVHNCVAPFTSHGKLDEFGAEKSFPELNCHILTFLR